MEDIFEELRAGVSDDDEENVLGEAGPRDDEAEEVNEDTRRVVKPKRMISRPRPKLDATRLLGPRGMFNVCSSFDGIKFKGKGHELDDLNNVLTRLQHWAHRLFPKLKFADCIDKIEDLGLKREILTNMHKLRMGIIDTVPTHELVNDVDEVIDEPSGSLPQMDVFDTIIPTAPPDRTTTLTEEQRARMMRNRLLAEERRMARRLAKEKEIAQFNLNENISMNFSEPNVEMNGQNHCEHESELHSINEGSTSVLPNGDSPILKEDCTKEPIEDGDTSSMQCDKGIVGISSIDQENTEHSSGQVRESSHEEQIVASCVMDQEQIGGITQETFVDSELSGDVEGAKQNISATNEHEKTINSILSEGKPESVCCTSETMEVD